MWLANDIALEGWQMYCIKCGKEIPNDADFCCYCGKPQNDRTTQDEARYMYVELGNSTDRLGFSSTDKSIIDEIHSALRIQFSNHKYWDKGKMEGFYNGRYSVSWLRPYFANQFEYEKFTGSAHNFLATYLLNKGFRLHDGMYEKRIRWLPFAEFETWKRERGLGMNQGVLFQVRVVGSLYKSQMHLFEKVIDVYNVIVDSSIKFVFYDEIRGLFSCIEISKCTRI